MKMALLVILGVLLVVPAVVGADRLFVSTFPVGESGGEKFESSIVMVNNGTRMINGEVSFRDERGLLVSWVPFEVFLGLERINSPSELTGGGVGAGLRIFSATISVNKEVDLSGFSAHVSVKVSRAGDNEGESAVDFPFEAPRDKSPVEAGEGIWFSVLNPSHTPVEVFLIPRGGRRFGPSLLRDSGQRHLLLPGAVLSGFIRDFFPGLKAGFVEVSSASGGVVVSAFRVAEGGGRSYVPSR